MFDGRPLGDVPAEVWRRWRDDRGFRPEGGESLAEVEERVVGGVRGALRRGGCGGARTDGDVVVVSHVTPIKAAVAWALGVGDLSFRLHLRTGSVTRIGWGAEGPVLHAFNEVWPPGHRSAADPARSGADAGSAVTIPGA